MYGKPGQGQMSSWIDALSPDERKHWDAQDEAERRVWEENVAPGDRKALLATELELREWDAEFSKWPEAKRTALLKQLDAMEDAARARIIQRKLQQEDLRQETAPADEPKESAEGEIPQELLLMRKWKATQPFSEPDETKRTDTSKSTNVAGIAVWLFLFLLGGIALLTIPFTGVGWIAEYVYPFATFLAAIAFFVVIPLSSLLSIFKKHRDVGATGLLVSSYVIGLYLWVTSLIIAYGLAGVYWLVVGVLFAGIGVVAVALVAALLSGEWSVAAQILLMVILVYGIRMFSFFLAERSTKGETMRTE